MVNGINMGVGGFKQNSYGNIQRVGASENGRVLYRVIDSNGQEAGKLTVAGKDTDKFEQSYREIMEAAPKIQKFVTENSSEEDIKKVINENKESIADVQANVQDLLENDLLYVVGTDDPTTDNCPNGYFYFQIEE